jgi:hypothetical protein
MTGYLEELPGQAKEQALVFCPLVTVQYDYEGASYECVVDASTGEVSSVVYPRRATIVYFVVALGAFAICFAEGAMLHFKLLPAIAALVVTVPAIAWFGVQVVKAR